MAHNRVQARRSWTVKDRLAQIAFTLILVSRLFATIRHIFGVEILAGRVRIRQPDDPAKFADAFARRGQIPLGDKVAFQVVNCTAFDQAIHHLHLGRLAFHELAEIRVRAHAVGVEFLARLAQRQIVRQRDSVQVRGLHVFEHIAADGIHADAARAAFVIAYDDIDHARLNLVAFTAFVVQAVQVEQRLRGNGYSVYLGHGLVLL